jgi:hypothetical protein
MRFFVRFCWTISLIGFLYNLFTTYANLKQTVGINFGETLLFIPRGSYFFFFFSFFLALNITLFLLSRSFRSMPKALLLVPFAGYWTQSKEHRRAANQILENWCWAIAATANYFLMYWMLIVETNYHFEGNTVSAVNWFYLPGYLMIASLVLPLFRLMVRNPNMLARVERE